MKIAITGANGYIGASLVKKCLDFGHSVVAVDLLGLIQEQPKVLWMQLCLFKQFKNDKVWLFLLRRKLLIMKNGSAKKNCYI